MTLLTSALVRPIEGQRSRHSRSFGENSSSSRRGGPNVICAAWRRRNASTHRLAVAAFRRGTADRPAPRSSSPSAPRPSGRAEARALLDPPLGEHAKDVPLGQTSQRLPRRRDVASVARRRGSPRSVRKIQFSAGSSMYSCATIQTISRGHTDWMSSGSSPLVWLQTRMAGPSRGRRQGRGRAGGDRCARSRRRSPGGRG